MKRQMLNIPISLARALVVGVMTLVLGQFAGAAEESKSMLCQGNYQTEAQAKEQLARFAKLYTGLDAWKARTETIRQGILRGAELLPLPEKTPLNPIIHSKREGPSRRFFVRTATGAVRATWADSDPICKSDAQHWQKWAP